MRYMSICGHVCSFPHSHPSDTLTVAPSHTTIKSEASEDHSEKIAITSSPSMREKKLPSVNPSCVSLAVSTVYSATLYDRAD
jgi:hypothetical protein